MKHWFLKLCACGYNLMAWLTWLECVVFLFFFRSPSLESICLQTLQFILKGKRYTQSIQKAFLSVYFTSTLLYSLTLNDLLIISTNSNPSWKQKYFTSFKIAIFLSYKPFSPTVFPFVLFLVNGKRLKRALKVVSFNPSIIILLLCCACALLS